MSNRTGEVSKITTAIVSIFVRLMVYALIVLLLYETVTRDCTFGHEIFFTEAVDEVLGQDMAVQTDSKGSASNTA